MYASIESIKRVTVRVACSVAMMTPLAIPAAAQDKSAPDTAIVSRAAPPETPRAQLRPVTLSNFRPHDARSLTQFEAPKPEGVDYHGFQLEWGAAFTQQFQDLNHDNNATPNIVAGTDLNQLIPIGAGFNNADANLYMDAQLAKGTRVALTSYLSSRHHNETWVKDGYLLINASPWENDKLDAIMKYLTFKFGHFEINYGDMHFRRTDNGQAMFNPLVGNLIMDAFTTEIGGEVYGRANGYLGMLAVTGGEVRGTVLKPENRSPSVIGKLGFDKNIADARVRLTGSVYTTHTSNNNTLYSGSRAGSRYYYVLENVNATESAQAWSGDLQPGFSRAVTAWVVNPFVQYKGLELFGNFEQARGHNAVETGTRTWTQYAGDGVYRFFKNQLYLAARYDVAKGRLAGFTSDVTIDRTEAGGGWFLTPNMEAKAEYVQQNYKDYPVNDIHHGGKFDGVMIEAVVSF
jgi:hypothetical protein